MRGRVCILGVHLAGSFHGVVNSSTRKDRLWREFSFIQGSCSIFFNRGYAVCFMVLILRRNVENVQCTSVCVQLNNESGQPVTPFLAPSVLAEA